MPYTELKNILPTAKYYIYDINDKSNKTEVSENFYMESEYINQMIEDISELSDIDALMTYGQLRDKNKNIQAFYFPIASDYCDINALNNINTIITNDIDINELTINDIVRMLVILKFLHFGNYMMDMLFNILINKIDEHKNNLTNEEFTKYFTKQFMDNYYLVTTLFNKIYNDNPKIIKKFFNVNDIELPNDINHRFVNMTQIDIDCIEPGFKKNVIKLNINDSQKITDLNEFVNLEELDAVRHININDNGIRNLTKLKALYVYDTPNIKNVNHMVNLEILCASGSDCGICDDGIKNITNLRCLYAENNPNITNINHMIKLKLLHAGYRSGITDNGISSLTNIKILNVSYNRNITKISHMINLEELNDETAFISDDEIKNLTKIKKLLISNNASIKNIDHLIDLEELEVEGKMSNITDDSIKNLKNIKRLRVSNNPNITKISHMTELECLDASDDSGITDEELKNLHKIKNLYVSNNPNIKDINHLTELEYLDANYKSGISDRGIKYLTKIKWISFEDNPKIKDAKWLMLSSY